MDISRGVVLLLGVLTCTILSPEPLLAQEQSSPTEALPAGVITTGTIAVAELNLSQVNAPALFDMLAQINPVPPAFSMTVNVFVQTLRDAGVEHIYITVPTRWMVQGGVCVVLPCRDVEVVKRLATDVVAMLPAELQYTVLDREAMVIVCPQPMVAGIEAGQEAPPEQRARFDAAFASAESLPHRLVLSLPENLRQEVAALWPLALSITEGVTIQPGQLIQEIRSVAIGVSLPPEVQVQLHVLCQDHAGAEHVKQQLDQLFRVIPDGAPQPTVEIRDVTVIAGFSGDQMESLQVALLRPARSRAYNMQTMNNVKQLGLALHNYHDTFNHFPGKYTVDADRRPLLSWRVALLPFLEQAPLYDKFKLHEPWDSPHNKALLAEMPDVFDVADDKLPEGLTRIRLPVIEGGPWSGEGPPRTIKDFTDGLSNTIWVAVAPESAAVEWTRPDDWQLEAENLVQSFFGDAESTIIGRGDGSVQSISRETSADVLRALLTIAGGEVVEADDVK